MVVEVPNLSMRWVTIGVLDLDLTRADLLAVDASYYRAAATSQLCSAGTEIRLRSMMETDSRSRRNTATARILGRKALVPNLIDYFDQRKELSANVLGVAVEPDLLKRTYGFNDSQANAFRSLWNKRPLGLLQGPPGTGKTKFIAALIHYALSLGIARNVLLASRSHQAVNNAAENVLALFRREQVEPSMIRVGQEGNVSDVLKPYHSAKVESHYREQFRAGLKDRLEIAGRHIGLQEPLIDDIYFLEATVRPVFQQIQALARAAEEGAPFEDGERRIKALRLTMANLCEKLEISNREDRNWLDAEMFDELLMDVAARHRTTSLDFIRRFRGISELSRDWIGTVASRRRSFEEFLAKTRQIVCGTCVGLGRSSLGLTTSSFDLVVIDEAARCTPSELAVPMQAGRWVMLEPVS